MESVENISSEVVKEHRSNFWNMLIPQGFFCCCLFVFKEDCGAKLAFVSDV